MRISNLLRRPSAIRFFLTHIQLPFPLVCMSTASMENVEKHRRVLLHVENNRSLCSTEACQGS